MHQKPEMNFCDVTFLNLPKAFLVGERKKERELMKKKKAIGRR